MNEKRESVRKTAVSPMIDLALVRGLGQARQRLCGSDADDIGHHFYVLVTQGRMSSFWAARLLWRDVFTHMRGEAKIAWLSVTSPLRQWRERRRRGRWLKSVQQIKEYHLGGAYRRDSQIVDGADAIIDGIKQHEGGHGKKIPQN